MEVRDGVAGRRTRPALRAGVAVLVLPALATVAGCEGWPRYLYSADDAPGDLPPRYVFEDEQLGATRLDLQDVGTIEPGGTTIVSGYAFNCGYEEEPGTPPWPEWPEHELDVDGDGEPDTREPVHSGWFTGDVDFYVVEAAGTGSLSVTLEWTHRPEGDNAPYRPSDPTGAWSSESDLDFVVFALDGDGGAGEVTHEDGFDSAYPAAADPPLFLESGQVRIVSVACHHNVPSDYTLTLALEDG